jgi:hypothetical protein
MSSEILLPVLPADADGFASLAGLALDMRSPGILRLTRSGASWNS